MRRKGFCLSWCRLRQLLSPVYNKICLKHFGLFVATCAEDPKLFFPDGFFYA